MKTKHTYIFTIIRTGMMDEASDTRACGAALFKKYSRNENCHLVEIELSDSHGGIEKFDPEMGKSTLVEEKGERVLIGDVGIYIVGNFSMLNGTLETITAITLAQMLKWLGFKEIRKLCLVACKAAAEPKDSVNTKSFLIRLCDELAAGPGSCTPMIAGWDSYVEIMTLSPIRYRDTKDKVPFGVNDALDNQGAKIASISANKNDFMKVSKEASRHKQVIQWNGHTMKAALLGGGWSDKTI